MNYNSLITAFKSQGAIRLYVKFLAPNDNSKNQPYFGGDFSSLNIFPYHALIPDSSGPRKRFKAALDFAWLDDNGIIHPAPATQLILYPKYPEVRFSGFLRGCVGGPNEIMSVRDPGRVLFLGVTASRKVLGYAALPSNPVAKWVFKLREKGDLESAGVFYQIDLGGGTSFVKVELISELHRIHDLGWIPSKRLDADGEVTSCKSTNCGGFTLEAELGIRPNSLSEPDFKGWEVKQHSVNDFEKPEIGVITLMTPEPTGGFYKSRGAEAFIRKYGYEDTRGRVDRLNFGGLHLYHLTQTRTGLTLTLTGYDESSHRIVDPNGGVSLVDRRGNEAAVWSFTGILEHWRRKHAKAVFVPSMKRDRPRLGYRYGHLVRCGEGTDVLLFLRALTDRKVYYDPGIKLEGESTPSPTVKRRSQFRVKSKDIPSLYLVLKKVNVVTGEEEGE